MTNDNSGPLYDEISGRVPKLYDPESASNNDPTDQQLENFIHIMLAAQARRMGIEIDPAFGARMVMQNPALKRVWLKRHRDLQNRVRL